MTVSKLEIPLKKRMDPQERYPEYNERENQKAEGWKIVKNEKYTIPHQAHAALNCIIWAHYWRARIDIESSSKRKSLLKKIRGRKYYSGYILDIDHYTRHWLDANGDKLLGEEILIEIENTHGYRKEKNKYLPEGYSIYRFDNE